MKFIFIFFIVLCFGISAHAADTASAPDSASPSSRSIPTRIHIGYTVTTGIGHGELNEVVDINQKRDGHTFNITSDAQATGIFKIIKPGHIVRSSRGLVTDKGLQPVYYSDQRANKAPSLALFNWENKTLTLIHKGKETKETLATGTVDRLSLSYQFIFAPEVAALTETQINKLYEVYVTDGRSLQLMRFKISMEKLDTPLGRLETFVLTKLYDQDDPMQRKIWLAPDYHMIPVRIQSVEKDGLEVEKMITEISIGYDAQGASCCKH